MEKCFKAYRTVDAILGHSNTPLKMQVLAQAQEPGLYLILALCQVDILVVQEDALTRVHASALASDFPLDPGQYPFLLAHSWRSETSREDSAARCPNAAHSRHMDATSCKTAARSSPADPQL